MIREKEAEVKTSKKIYINSDLDIIVARLRAREVAREIGFGTIDQARISLAAGELARSLTKNVGQHGEIIISGIRTQEHYGIQVVSMNPGSYTDGPDNGQPALDNGQQQALSNATPLVDECLVENKTGGVRITLVKWLS